MLHAESYRIIMCVCHNSMHAIIISMANTHYDSIFMDAKSVRSCHGLLLKHADLHGSYDIHSTQVIAVHAFTVRLLNKIHWYYYTAA